MKQVFHTWCAIFALIVVSGVVHSVAAQSASATPDPFVTQITSSPASGSLFQFSSFASDMSANGRFVVFESNGDVATEKIPTLKADGTPNANPRNNEDGNREIFLLDYAQRRVYQITNTKNVPLPTPTPSPTPSPSPSPSPSPGASPTPTPSPSPTPLPTPADPQLTKIEISNNKPMISLEPQVVNGKRVYVIVFSSNAPNPGNFDGVETAALTGDPNNGWNTEIWTYELPAVADVDLTSGSEVFVDLVNPAGFTKITNTPASRQATPGGTFVAPFTADDNREAAISDDGTRIVFTSTRNLVPAVGNADGSPEIFVFNRGSSTFVQLTKTQDVFDNGGRLVFSVFSQNPSISADGSVIAFISNANLVLNSAGVAVEGAGDNGDDTNGRGNGEIYMTGFGGSSLSNFRQVTKTKTDATQVTVNLFSPGRRLSRDGSMLLLDSLATDPKANASTNEQFFGVFLYTAATNTFNLVALRALPPAGDFGFIHYPVFSDYNASLQPASILFSSPLNYKADGTFPAAGATDGLNPNNQTQIWATQIPVASTNTLARLTNTPISGSFALRAIASASRRRLSFSLSGAELGGGNSDFSSEVFYLLSPADTSESTAALSFFTGASAFPVPTATPAASGSPTPSPSPSPSPSPAASPTPATTALGLSPGELALIRADVDLAPSNASSAGGAEGKRSPPLPVELNGVSVSVNGAASGLYFVGNNPRQINFVIPIGVPASTTPVKVVVNNNGTVFRSGFQLITTQPDIFTSTNGAGGIASICNITNGFAFPCLPGPFKVQSPDQSGTLVATRLLMNVTGLRLITAASQVTVTVGTTDIAASAVRPNLQMPGFDIIEFVLPADLAPGDYPVVVKVNPGGAILPSRPAETAPHVVIAAP